MNIVLALVAAYLLGSIPFGYIIGRMQGIDITQTGSGNIGATNAFRILGPGPGAAVLVLDGAKAALATYIGRHVGGNGSHDPAGSRYSRARAQLFAVYEF